MVLLCGVCEMEVERKAADEALDLPKGGALQAGHEPLEARWVGRFAQGARGGAYLLNELVEVFAPLRLDHVAQDAAHLANIGAQLGVGGGLEERHEVSIRRSGDVAVKGMP